MSDQAQAPAPRKNDLLVGQDAAMAELAGALRSGRLPHGWLLAGPRGVGKATLAFRFARHLLAGGRSADDLALDPEHPVFRRVASGGHRDLLTVERAYDEKKDRLRTEIVVPDVRRIGDFIHMTPAEGGWRVVVIDGAEDMNRHAANALLKVLEEPSSRTVLLLVSHAPGRLLPTIRSRCRRLALGPLADETVEDLLARYRPETTAADAAILAQLSEGSIGRALTLAEEGGLELYRKVGGLLVGLPELDAQALHALADRFARKDGETAFRVAVELLVGWLGRMIRSAASGASPAEIVPGETAAMTRLMAGRSLDRWLELWDKTSRLLARTEGANLDRRQVWVAALLDIEVLARS